MATRQNTIQDLKELLKFKRSEDIDEVIKAVNKAAAIHADHLKEIQDKCKAQDFKDINGRDFNYYYHDFTDLIESIYFSLKDQYHNLHWDKYGFNAYSL